MFALPAHARRGQTRANRIAPPMSAYPAYRFRPQHRQRPMQPITFDEELTDNFEALTDKRLVGSRVEVEWFNNRTYVGIVDHIDLHGRYFVRYDDGDERYYNLRRTANGQIIAFNRGHASDVHRFSFITTTSHSRPPSSSSSSSSPSSSSSSSSSLSPPPPQLDKEIEKLVQQVNSKQNGCWVCHKCTLINIKTGMRCSACHTKRLPPKCIACMDETAVIKMNCHNSKREELCVTCFNTYLKTEVHAGKIHIPCPFAKDKKCSFLYSLPILRQMVKRFKKLDQSLPKKMAKTLRDVQKQVTANQMKKNHHFSEWLAEQRGNVRLCPECCVRIEKNKGCNHMQCVRCGHDFQWNEEGMRLPKSVKEIQRDKEFEDMCTKEENIVVGGDVTLYWPSYRMNYDGNIMKLEDQRIHVTFLDGDRRQYSLDTFLERKEQAEEHMLKAFPPIPKFPTIPSLTNVTSYIPRVAVSRITTGPPRSFASMVLADAFSPETLLMSGGSGSGSGSGGGSSSNSSNSSSSSSSSSTSAASSSPSPSPSSNSIGTTITRRRKRSSVTKTKTKGNDTAQPKLLRRSKRLRVS